MSFLSNIVAGFKAALPVLEEGYSVAAAVAPTVANVVATVDPKTAPAIAAAEGAIASVTQIAPSAVQTAGTAISAIETLLATGGAESQQLKALFNAVGKTQAVGQIVVATPKTTAATVPLT